MDPSARMRIAARSPIRAVVFSMISVPLLPVMLLGYGIWVGKLYLVGRTSGASTTAQGPLFARWLMHELGLRQDEPAHRLLMVAPGISHLALRMVAGPILLAHRLSGFVPRPFRYPFRGEIAPHHQASARVTFYDAVVERHLGEITQFVILGAGFDTRALRLPAGTRVRSFEVDTAKTLATKRRMLTRAGINSTGVTFVAADFEKDDWLARLVEAGFDPTRPALFLWEGVTAYLDETGVRTTLRRIAATARRSVVAFDYFTTEVFASRAPYWRYARAMTKAAREPMKFGVDSTPPSRERLAELLRSCGLSLAEQCTLGRETRSSRAWGGFTTAIV